MATKTILSRNNFKRRIELGAQVSDWQGDLSFGPTRDGRPTFQRLDGDPRWAGLPGLDEAGTRVVESYFRAYGPATIDNVRYWTGAGQKRAQSWIAGLGDRLAAVEIDGERAHLLREDLRELAATPPTTAVRLLRDTTNGSSVRALPMATSCRPPGGRWSAVRHRSWSSAVSCPWALTDDHVTVAWFAEVGPLPLSLWTRTGEPSDRGGGYPLWPAPAYNAQTPRNVLPRPDE